MKETSTKKIYTKMIFFCLPLCALAVFLSWISILVNANRIIRSNVYAVSLLDLIISVCEISIYATAIAFIVYAISQKRRSSTPFLIFFGLSALRYFSAAIVRGLAYGALTSEDLISAVIVLLTDAFIVGILTLVALAIHKKEENIRDDRKLHKAFAFIPYFSPAMSKSLFVSGIVWASIKLISQIIYDINYVILIGAPSFTNVVWMIIYYLFAMLICPVFYIVSSFTVRMISKN